MSKPGTKRFTVEYNRAGQPRPYADSITDFTLTVEWIPYWGEKEWTPSGLNEDIVTNFARALVWWADDPEWHEPRLDSKRQIEKGVWRFVVRQPYLD